MIPLIHTAITVLIGVVLCAVILDAFHSLNLNGEEK